MTLWLACCSSLCLKPSPCLQAKARRYLGWLPSACHQRAIGGFTLAELLISLAILGVIATFTLPKIIYSSQSQRNIAIEKEAASMVVAAFQQYANQNTVSSSLTFSSLTPYMNYVATDTASAIDGQQTVSTVNCATPFRCLKLHNGAILRYNPADTFGGTATTNAIWCLVDPDGVVTDGTTNGPGHAVVFWIYANGRMATMGTLAAGTTYGGGAVPATPAYDPPWFIW